jgi:hypothetical protein
MIKNKEKHGYKINWGIFIKDAIHDLLVVAVIVATVWAVGYLFWNGLEPTILYIGRVII